jgi:hypothetical protein
METPELTHYQKYKGSIENWRKRNQDNVNAYARRRRILIKEKLLVETNKQIALEYIMTHGLPETEINLPEL